MTCINLGNSIICVTPPVNCGRLHVNGKYVYVEFHEYCGPFFFKDYGGSVEYIPQDEDDPVWPEFTKWYDKYQKKKAAMAAKRFSTKPPLATNKQGCLFP